MPANLWRALRFALGALHAIPGLLSPMSDQAFQRHPSTLVQAFRDISLLPQEGQHCRVCKTEEIVTYPASCMLHKHPACVNIFICCVP